MVVEQGSSGSTELFAAFREERSSKFRWLIVVAVPLFGALAAWVSMAAQPEGMRIVTSTGIKMVTLGMSQQEVLGLLGRPIAKDLRADGAECLQHGMFSINEPSTTVYVLCYMGGQLREMATRRFSVWMVDPTGALVPAGVPFEEEKTP
jgi:hypothetical protein